MSGTMVRQGGRVQLEQSNMRLTLKMAKAAKEGFSCARIEERQQLIKKPRAEVREEKMGGVVFPWYNTVKPAIERHWAIVWENPTDGCLPCQHGTAKNAQTRWRRKGMGEPPARPVPPRPGTPPVPPDDSERTQCSETEGVPAGYLYIHTPLPSAPLFTLDPYGKDRMGDTDYIPDLLTDEGPSTG